MVRDEYVIHIEIESVVIGDRRDVDEKVVTKLAESIREVGLQHPITVRKIGDDNLLVAGRHRLEAVRSLGNRTIQAHVVRWSKDDARMWEISENLHRAELKDLDRKEQIAEWIRLRQAKRAREEGVSGQLAPKPQGGRPEGGTVAAARELGIEETEAKRAVQVAKLTDGIKAAIREAGLDDNQSALLAIARTDFEQQAAKIIELATPETPEQARAAWLNLMMRNWNKAPQEWREAFREAVDNPVMDQRYAPDTEHRGVA